MDPELGPEVVQSALETGVRLLARREHAVSELRLKLRQRGYPAEVIDVVVDDLSGRGYLNDQRFAEVFIRSKVDQGLGPLRIVAEMRKRGVEDAVFRPFLDAVNGWAARARALKCKRFGPKKPEDQRDWGRQGRFLAGRGFSAEQVARALDGADDEPT